MKKRDNNKLKRIMSSMFAALMLLTVVTVSNIAVDSESGIATCVEENSKVIMTF